MPTTLNWSEIDPLIREHLPSMTCVDFCRRFPFTISRTIGQRAKKLGVKPAIKKISIEHRLKVGLAQSKYEPTPEVDDFILNNNGKLSVIDMACKCITNISQMWSPYAIRKRMKEFGVKVIRVENRDPKKKRVFSSSNRVDWSRFDDLLRKNLPSMTIKCFQRKFMPDVSAKAIGRRAEKIEVIPGDYKPDLVCKQKISDGVREYVFQPGQDEFMINNVDRLGQVEFAEMFDVSQMAVWRRMNELGLKRDLRFLLLEFQRGGKIGGPIGSAIRQRQLQNMTIIEFNSWREKVSRSCQLAFKEGRIKPRFGIGSNLKTKKGGSFRTRSSYETRYAELLDVDDSVVRFEYEPFEIEYEFDSVRRFYNPDFLVLYVDRTELVEVKPKRFLNEEKNPAKFLAAERYCLDEGIDFVVVTEEDL